jgi:Zn-dependent M28 family amino/carboxypeptidase
LKNIICHKKGATNKILLFCAHYDTILMRDFEDTVSRAPGADDNASGVSALLEICRIISQLDFEYSIRFAFFSGEEQGLWGSKHYAEYIKDRKEDLYAVVNLDMCAESGFLANNNTTNIDVDDGTTGSVSTNNEASQILGQKMEQMAQDYTNMAVEYDPIAYSDYMPFEARGYICIGAYDGSAIERNKHYHSDDDIPSNLNMDFLTSVTKMVLAFALSEAHVHSSNP